MKVLETQFVRNADGLKNQQFTQLQRNGNVALYERKDLDTDKLVGYEVFEIKVISAGFKFMPTSEPVTESYEYQPGKSAFGKTAWFCTTLERAESRFNAFLNNEKLVRNDDEPIIDDVESTVNVETPKQTKKQAFVIDVNNVKLPEGHFTRKTFAELNNMDYSTGSYLVIKQLITENKIEAVGTQKAIGGRGKPAVVYSVKKIN